MELQNSDRGITGFFKVQEDKLNFRMKPEKTLNKIVFSGPSLEEAVEGRTYVESSKTKQIWRRRGEIQGAMLVSKTVGDRAESLLKKRTQIRKTKVVKEPRGAKSKRKSVKYPEEDPHTSDWEREEARRLEKALEESILEEENNQSSLTGGGSDSDEFEEVSIDPNELESLINEYSENSQSPQSVSEKKEEIEEELVVEKCGNPLLIQDSLLKSQSVKNRQKLEKASRENSSTDESSKDKEKTLVHILALGPATLESIKSASKYDEYTINSILPRISNPVGERYRLKPENYATVDIWKWPKYTYREREKAAEQASRAMDLLGVPQHAKEREFINPPNVETGGGKAGSLQRQASSGTDTEYIGSVVSVVSKEPRMAEKEPVGRTESKQVTPMVVKSLSLGNTTQAQKRYSTVGVGNISLARKIGIRVKADSVKKGVSGIRKKTTTRGTTEGLEKTNSNKGSKSSSISPVEGRAIQLHQRSDSQRISSEKTSESGFSEFKNISQKAVKYETPSFSTNTIDDSSSKSSSEKTDLGHVAHNKPAYSHKLSEQTQKGSDPMTAHYEGRERQTLVDTRDIGSRSPEKRKASPSAQERSDKKAKISTVGVLDMSKKWSDLGRSSNEKHESSDQGEVHTRNRERREEEDDHNFEEEFIIIGEEEEGKEEGKNQEKSEEKSEDKGKDKGEEKGEEEERSKQKDEEEERSEEKDEEKGEEGEEEGEEEVKKPYVRQNQEKTLESEVDVPAPHDLHVSTPIKTGISDDIEAENKPNKYATPGYEYEEGEATDDGEYYETDTQQKKSEEYNVNNNSNNSNSNNASNAYYRSDSYYKNTGSTHSSNDSKSLNTFTSYKFPSSADSGRAREGSYYRNYKAQGGTVQPSAYRTREYSHGHSVSSYGSARNERKHTYHTGSNSLHSVSRGYGGNYQSPTNVGSSRQLKFNNSPEPVLNTPKTSTDTLSYQLLLKNSASIPSPLINQDDDCNMAVDQVYHAKTQSVSNAATPLNNTYASSTLTKFKRSEREDSINEYQSLWRKLEELQLQRSRVLMPLNSQWNSANNQFKKELRSLCLSTRHTFGSSGSDSSGPSPSDSSLYFDKLASYLVPYIANNTRDSAFLFSELKAYLLSSCTFLSLEQLYYRKKTTPDQLSAAASLQLDPLSGASSTYADCQLYIVGDSRDTLYLCGYKPLGQHVPASHHNQDPLGFNLPASGATVQQPTVHGSYEGLSSTPHVNLPTVFRPLLPSENLIWTLSNKILEISNKYWSDSVRKDTRRLLYLHEQLAL
ncbi:hypothetical protein AX774_g1153 [Zancudomyces culisetae]|uniref:Uncharacterized protein n=1 Tax=Zancudomyces culisetae TaxID=1213189 RepID=A0A1R1PWK6_ZANCU|nr:hypothetical protein AX774_g1153 [Zancudomyces culisetae]|eukprot:OMH85307.1 hypothetical protein AX774_g1153 [Zancudomyces culisetae]